MSDRTPAVPLPDTGGRVCIVLLTGIGDVVHGLPLANALAAARPDLTIDWVAEPAPAEVLRNHPAIDRIIVFRKNDGVRGLLRLRRDLRELGRYDLVINAQRYFKSIPPTLFAGAPVRLGLSRDKTRDGVSLFNTHHLTDGPWRHTQDLLLDFLPRLGLPRPDPPVWHITFSEAETREAEDYFRRSPGPRVGVVMGTASALKDWPVEYYPDLVDGLAERFGFRVYLLGGPGERERRATDFTVANARTAPVPALAASVRQLMWKIRGMDLVISPDTGPLHIARALAVPVIGLYGHTNPARVGPYDTPAELIIDRYTDPGTPPDPSGYEPRHGRMGLIRPEDVLARVTAVGTGETR